MYLNDDFFKLFDKVDKLNIDEGELYTLVKGDLKVYLTHYTKEVDMIDKDNDEAVVSVFRNGSRIFKIGGSIEHILNEIIKILL